MCSARSRVYLPSNTPEYFATKLKEKDAEVIYHGEAYEQSVLAAIEDATRTGATLLSDASWQGYNEAPRLVMEGYTVMAEEMRREFEQHGIWPSHVILQAGVGGLAAAITYMIRRYWRRQPSIIVVEPECAACLQLSVAAGFLVAASGGVSNMARLDCKNASLLAYQILRNGADQFVTITEDQALQAMQAANDMGIATTSSGAAGMAFVLHGKELLPNALCVITEENSALY